MKQLSLLGWKNLKVADLVEIAHLLLSASSPSQVSTESSTTEEEAMDEWLERDSAEGDEICLWWIHLLAAALYWKHGNMDRAKNHYATVRKCPSKLLNRFGSLLDLLNLRAQGAQEKNQGDFSVNLRWELDLPSVLGRFVMRTVTRRTSPRWP